MNLGFASPVSLRLLRHLVRHGENLPLGYQFAPTADWVQELMKRGHHVFLYTTANEFDSPRTFHGDGITIRIAPQRRRGTGRDLFAVERDQLQEMMTADGCQLIHAHWTYQFALAALASGIPTLVTIHDLPWRVLQTFRDLHRAARLVMAYQVALRGQHFTAVSSDAASHFARYLKPNAQITVIPNGLPDSLFELGTRSKRHSDDPVTFATILQGWSDRKNARSALQAFQFTKRGIPDAQLVMFGIDYQRGGPAHQWAIQNSLDAGVNFVGPLAYSELLDRITRTVDVVVHPSVDEAFSMTALEALALRKVCIAGIATPGMREMLGAGEAGILVDVTVPSAIAAVMIKVARDCDYRNHVAQAGFDHASSSYRLCNVFKEYEDKYLSVLNT